MRCLSRILIAVGFLAVCDRASAEAPVHWVTWQQDPCHTLVISWISTDKEKREGQLWYRAESTGGDVSEWHEVRASVFPFPFLDTTRFSQVELTGLTSATTYRLSWNGPTDRTVPTARVATMPETLATPLDFIVVGDSFCSEYRTGGVTAHLAREAARWNPRFAIIPGNIAFASGDETALGHRWLEWLTVWSDGMKSPDGRSIPTLFTIGSHEVKGFDAQPVGRAGAFYRLCATTGIRGYTAIDFGNYLSIFLLDSGHTNAIDGGQRDWLEAALTARTNRPHRIAAYHHSVRVSSDAEIHQGAALELAAKAHSHPWAPLFERYGLAAAIENDSRTRQAAFARTDRTQDLTCVLYIGNGAVHESLSSAVNVENSRRMEKSATTSHFIVGTIAADRQEYKTVALDGQLIDRSVVEIPVAAQHSVGTVEPIVVALPKGEPPLSKLKNAIAITGDAIDVKIPESTGIPVIPARPNRNRRKDSGRTLHVPRDYATLSAAVAAALPGDTIAIAPGEYREAIIIDKSISLVGSGPLATRLRALDRAGAGDFAIKIRSGCDVAISELTVGDGYRGIVVDPAGRLDVRHIYVLDNTRDGIYMEQGPGDVYTYLYMERCLVSGTADGVDFMGGQGYILDCIFRDNSDDGLDFDGDSGAVVAGCLFSHNRDDGIEVRLKQRTYIFSIENTFDQNGEDGFEVIDTFLPENGTYNVISLQNNRFYSNRRFAISFVDQKTEKDGSKPVSSAVYIGPNEFVKPGQANVTDNYRNAVDLAAAIPDRVKVTLGTGKGARTSEHKMITPALVGIYDLKAMTDGTQCSDTEDVAVSSTRVYIPDDDKRVIYVLDRLNGDLLQRIPMTPIRGSQQMAKGPEGVHVVEGPDGDEKLWVCDDDGLSIYQISLIPETYGHLLNLQSTAELGPCEGIAVLGEQMYVTRTNGLVIVPTSASKKPINPTVRITSDLFGYHFAGVSVDSTGRRLFTTTTGYQNPEKSWRGRDKPSGVYELTPDLSEVKNVWDLGPYCDDLRGVAYRDRLLYAACGRSPYTDEKTGELVRNGQKVFVFVVDGHDDLAAGHNTQAIRDALKYLPLRSGR